MTKLIYASLFNDIETVKSILDDQNEDICCADSNGVRMSIFSLF